MRFPVVVLALVSAPLCAADFGLPYIDLRATFGGAGGITQVGTSGSTVDYDNRLGLQLAVEGILRQRFSSRVGYCVGLGAFAVGHAGENQGDSDVRLSYTAAGIELTAGLTFQIVHGFHLELRPFYRVGRGILSVTNDGNGPVQDEDGATGAYQGVGALLGGYYTFPFGLQLGGQLGIEGFSGESEMNRGLVTTQGGGPFLRVTAGYSF